jgi:hypothetical protein
MGAAPQGADRVLPRQPEVHQAYIEGMEKAMIRRFGGGAPSAEVMLQDRSLRLLQEQLRVHGPEVILGAKLHPNPPGQGKFLDSSAVQDSLDHMDPTVRQREMTLILNCMEQAREKHAQVAELRADLGTQSPEALRLVGEIKGHYRGGHIDSPYILEAYRQQELRTAAPKVRSEFKSLKPYFDLRTAAVAQAEAGDMGGAARLQEQAHTVFASQVVSGGISEETVQGIRNAGMDPASTFEGLRGVQPSQLERQWLDRQIKSVRESVPSASTGVRTFAFRAPGRVFEEPLPLVAYQYEGQTHVVYERGGKIQHASVSEAAGNAGHPSHAIAVQFQQAMVHADGLGGPSDFKLSQKGFVPLERYPVAPRPSDGVPIHVGVDRSRVA